MWAEQRAPGTAEVLSEEPGQRRGTDGWQQNDQFLCLLFGLFLTQPQRKTKLQSRPLQSKLFGRHHSQGEVYRRSP